MPLRLFNNVAPINHQYRPGNLTIFFQNINGWSSKEKREDIKTFVRRQRADIVLFAHTNLDKDTNPIFFYPYVVYQHNTERLCSGVAILIKRDIEHKIINRKFKSDTLAIEVSTSQGPIVVGTNYTPPRRNSLPSEDLKGTLGGFGVK